METPQSVSVTGPGHKHLALGKCFPRDPAAVSPLGFCRYCCLSFPCVPLRGTCYCLLCNNPLDRVLCFFLVLGLVVDTPLCLMWPHDHRMEGIYHGN